MVEYFALKTQAKIKNQRWQRGPRKGGPRCNMRRSPLRHGRALAEGLPWRALVEGLPQRALAEGPVCVTVALADGLVCVTDAFADGPVCVTVTRPAG